MSLILDETLAKRLASETKPLDMFSPDGELLGQFIPQSAKMSFPEIGLTDAELEARANDSNAIWYTPDEVMARLRAIK